MADRIAIGQSKMVTLNTASTIGLILFDGTAGQQAGLVVSNVTIPTSAVTIYKPDGTVFASAPNVTTSGAFIAGQALPVTGTYTILVAPSGASTGSLTLNLNNTTDVTGTITIGGPPASVTITTSGQKARLIFSGTAGQQVYLNISNVAIPASNVSILNPDGASLAGPTSVTTAGAVTPVSTLSVTGSYTVLIDPAGSVGNMTLFLALSTGAPTIAGFSPSIGAPGDQITVNGSNLVGTVIFNGGAQAVASPTTPSSVTAVIPTGATSGRISITTPNGTATSTDDLFVPPPPYAATDVAVTGRMASGDVKTVTLGSPNTIALIVFDAVAGQRFLLDYGAVTISASTFRVYRPDGQAFIETTGPGNTFKLSVLPDSGTYTIFIAPAGSSTGSAKLTLGLSTDINTSITVNGPPVAMTLRTPGQVERLTYTAVAGQRLSFSLTGVTGGIEVVADSNDQFVFADFTLDFETVSSSGASIITCTPVGAATPSATLRLFEPVINGTLILNGPPTAVSIAAPSQTAQLMLNASAGQNVFIRTSQMTVTSTVAILTPDGNTTLASIVTGSDALLEADNLPVSGTYLVRVVPVNQGPGSLNLTAYTVTDVTDTISIGGPASTETITTSGQKIRLSFNGTAGQFVNLQIATATIQSGTVQVTNPDGSVLSASGFTGSTVQALGMLPATGNYTIVISASGVQTGSITVSMFADVSAAIAIDGPPVSVTIGTPGQKVRLAFSGSTGQHINLTISNVTIPSSTVTIFAQDGSSALSQAVDANGAVMSIASLPQTGTYTILINPASQGTGSAQLALSSPTDVVRTITIDGGQVSETIDIPGQNGRLQFTGSAGQNVKLLITFLNMSAFNLSIQNPDGTDVTGGSNPILINTNGTAIDIRNLPQTGTYTVIVAPIGQATGSVTFSLTSTGVGALNAGIPSYEIITSSTATAAPVFPSIIVPPPPQQQIILSFTGSAGQRISLFASGHLRSNGSEMVSTIRVSAPDGTVVAQGNVPLAGPVTLQAAGEYTVTVTIGGIGVFSAIQYNVVDTSGTISIDGPAVTVTITTPGQAARLTFTAAAGQRVSLLPSHSSLAATIQIVDPNSAVVGSTFVSPGNRAAAAVANRIRPGGGIVLLPPFIDATTLALTGTYTVLVAPTGASTGSVTLNLYGPVDVTGTITPGGSPVQVAITTPGQNAALTFSGTSGQQVTVQMSGNSIGTVLVSLIAPDNSVVTSFNSNAPSFGLASQTLAQNGTYTIKVDPAGPAKGSITVTVTSP
ncbi:MAG TPA: hypothetical protein VNY82_19200 [Steroidobacteraceae bacterium]|nr:hypothetical protein [Steroidobacteraceae bacterium]